MTHHIGSGAFGQVWVKDDEKKAIKIIIVKDIVNVQSAIRELHVLRYSNDFIVKFFEAKFRYGCIEFYMEKMDMDLLKLIRKDVMSNKQVKTISGDIAQGLHFLHSNFICHRDIKPSNILVHKVKDEYRAKLCDFGLSRQFSNELHRGTDYMVTRWYRAPEVIDHSQTYNFAIDMWAFGCIVYEMFCRRPLFPLGKQSDLAEELKRKDEKIKRITDKALNTLVDNLIVKDPQKRWDSKKCIQFILEIPCPVYSQSYYLGSNIQDENVKDWFTEMLGDYSNNERAIMHGMMMVNGTNMNTDDCRYAVLIGYFLYNSYPEDEDFFNELWNYPTETNGKKIIKWICKFYKTNPNWFFISPYKMDENIKDKLIDMINERVTKKRKLK
jgi:serine/threonine protein kinase